MAFSDWLTPKSDLVDELSDMYEYENPAIREASKEYWNQRSKGTVIGQIDYLVQTEERTWCAGCGWVDGPCWHGK